MHTKESKTLLYSWGAIYDFLNVSVFLKSLWQGGHFYVQQYLFNTNDIFFAFAIITMINENHYNISQDIASVYFNIEISIIT